MNPGPYYYQADMLPTELSRLGCAAKYLKKTYTLRRGVTLALHYHDYGKQDGLFGVPEGVKFCLKRCYVIYEQPQGVSY